MKVLLESIENNPTPWNINRKGDSHIYPRLPLLDRCDCPLFRYRITIPANVTAHSPA